MSVIRASHADVKDQAISLTEVAPKVYACTAEGDPNLLFVVGKEDVLVVDSTATPVMARDIIGRFRTLCDLPFKHIVLSHYHAVRTLGATAFGAANIIASRGTCELIAERGAQDFKSELERFPRLFRSVESVPGLTHPNIVFDESLTVFVGEIEVQIIFAGRAHTKGDTVIWLPKERVLFGGDVFDVGATPYCGDAYLADWPETLEKVWALNPEVIIPGRGAARRGTAACRQAFDETRDFVVDMWKIGQRSARENWSLRETYRVGYPALKAKYGHWHLFEHCVSFSLSRAYDEARGIKDPRIWTSERDVALLAEIQGVAA